MSYMTLSLQEKTFFTLFILFAHIRQHCFPKYLRGRMHGRSPTSNFGGPSPQSPLGFRAWMQQNSRCFFATLCGPAVLRRKWCWHAVREEGREVVRGRDGWRNYTRRQGWTSRSRIEAYGEERPRRSLGFNEPMAQVDKVKTLGVSIRHLFRL